MKDGVLVAKNEIIAFLEVAPNLQSVEKELKNQEYITGIISDGYDCVTNHLKNRFGFDFTISNKLEFSKSVATVSKYNR